MRVGRASRAGRGPCGGTVASTRASVRRSRSSWEATRNVSITRCATTSVPGRMPSDMAKPRASPGMRWMSGCSRASHSGGSTGSTSYPSTMDDGVLDRELDLARGVRRDRHLRRRHRHHRGIRSRRLLYGRRRARGGLGRRRPIRNRDRGLGDVARSIDGPGIRRGCGRCGRRRCRCGRRRCGLRRHGTDDERDRTRQRVAAERRAAGVPAEVESQFQQNRALASFLAPHVSQVRSAISVPPAATS